MATLSRGTGPKLTEAMWDSSFHLTFGNLHKIWGVAKKFPKWFYCKHIFICLPLTERGHLWNTRFLWTVYKVKRLSCPCAFFKSTTPWRRIGEWRYSSTQSLTSAFDGGEWSASRPGRFTLRERAPGTNWIGGWVDSRAGLYTVVKRKIPSSSRKSNPRSPIVQSVAQRYTDWAITAVGFKFLNS
jgi:hypothetical protein